LSFIEATEVERSETAHPHSGLPDHEIQYEYDSDEVTVQMSDLVRQVAATEAAVDSATVGHTVKRSSEVGLHHTHLPMLDDYGVIEYDTAANEVSTTDRARPVAQAMRSIVDTVEETELGFASHRNWTADSPRPVGQ